MLCKTIFSFVFMYNLYLIFCLPTITKYNGEKEELLNNTLVLQNNAITVDENQYNNITNSVKRRVKRAKGGTDKFTEAATMTETKMFQMYLQLFKNLWASSYVGGAHPLHPDVPKPVIILFKQKIMAFFFPPIGEDAKKV